MEIVNFIVFIVICVAEVSCYQKYDLEQGCPKPAYGSVLTNTCV